MPVNEHIALKPTQIFGVFAQKNCIMRQKLTLNLRYRFLKAIPHKDPAKDAPSYFCKDARRALRGVALYKTAIPAENPQVLRNMSCHLQKRSMHFSAPQSGSEPAAYAPIPRYGETKRYAKYTA